jgi:hypothetical protein
MKDRMRFGGPGTRRTSDIAANTASKMKTRGKSLGIEFGPFHTDEKSTYDTTRRTGHIEINLGPRSYGPNAPKRQNSAMVVVSTGAF